MTDAPRKPSPDPIPPTAQLPTITVSTGPAPAGPAPAAPAYNGPAPAAPASGGPASGGPASGGPASGGPASGGRTPGAAAGGGPAATGTLPPAGPSPAPPGSSRHEPAATPEGHQPTAPVTSRPRVGPRRSGPLVRMGPWAPVAGALAGILAGVLVVLLLAGRADAFAERLALVFLTVGLTLLGAAAVLLADEVRLVRRSREANVRPAWLESAAGLVNGLTPARLLLGASAFVLFLSAYVGRG